MEWRVHRPGGEERALPYKRLMGMCRWMGSHFHDWIDYNQKPMHHLMGSCYNGVTFSMEFLEWRRTFSGFWG